MSAKKLGDFITLQIPEILYQRLVNTANAQRLSLFVEFEKLLAAAHLCR